MRSVRYPCRFSICSLTGYDCKIRRTGFTLRKEDVIEEFYGKHKKGKSHEDVKCVYFFWKKLNCFPRGLQKHFPNLTHLEITNCEIKEITKDDLQGLEGLVELLIDECQLMSLPDDLFTEMPNLREVSFYENQIEFASSVLLKPLLGREGVTVDLRKNKSIDACLWPADDASTESLEDLMKLIDEKCINPAHYTVPDLVITASELCEIYYSKEFSDLTIIAGEQEFKVHKKVLQMKSEVFARIIEDQSEATEIRIPNFSAKSVEALLKFIYTSEVPKRQNAMKNFKIANNFKVLAMKSIYEQHIYNRINYGNAWETFLFAHRFSSQQVKEKAFQQIISQIPEEVPVELMEDPASFRKLIRQINKRNVKQISLG